MNDPVEVGYRRRRLKVPPDRRRSLRGSVGPEASLALPHSPRPAEARAEAGWGAELVGQRSVARPRPAGDTYPDQGLTLVGATSAPRAAERGARGETDSAPPARRTCGGPCERAQVLRQRSA
jgi:hypothetical protein